MEAAGEPGLALTPSRGCARVEFGKMPELGTEKILAGVGEDAGRRGWDGTANAGVDVGWREISSD